jgi:hypothetical protein
MEEDIDTKEYKMSESGQTRDNLVADLANVKL